METPTLFIFITFCILNGMPSGLCANFETVLFDRFLKTFNKSYGYNNTEYYSRYTIFVQNLQVLEAMHNREKSYPATAVFGINKFSDLSPSEFKETYLSYYNFKKSFIDQTKLPLTVKGEPVGRQLPKQVDWAFTTTELVESIHAKNTGRLTPLSSQEVIDCSYGFSNLFGCRGGDTCTSLKWMNETKTPIIPARDYPDIDAQQQCDFSFIKKADLKVNVTDYTCNSFVKKEDLLLRTIASFGPVSVSVDATSWQNYLGGIIQYHCGEEANNHAVLIVGYDLTGDIPYYIVKNSWGEDFGDSGYVYIAAYKNMCGIANEVSTVQVQ